MKPMNEEHFAILRRHMVEKIAIHSDRMEHELGKAALDERVLAAMLKVPRHLFVPAPLEQVAQTARKRGLIVLLSDLQSPAADIAPYVADSVRRGEPAELLGKLSVLVAQSADQQYLLPCRPAN